MAQILVTKIGSDGLPTEHDVANDDVTFQSYTVNGGGPVIDVSGIDMNSKDISEVEELQLNSVTDVAGEVDNFRLPVLAGAPSATPSNSGEGFAVWDSVGDSLYIWDGASWQQQASGTTATKVQNAYTAGEALAKGEVLYISAANEVSRADKAAVGTSRAIGFAAANASSAASVDVCKTGVIDGFTGLTPGSPQFLDATGGLTETLPIGSGNVLVLCGYAKSATEVDIQIQRLGIRA